jgi:hypothetical protein
MPGQRGALRLTSMFWLGEGVTDVNSNTVMTTARRVAQRTPSWHANHFRCIWPCRPTID